MPRGAEPFGTPWGRAVHLPDAAALVVADLHLGRAAGSAVDAPLAEGPTIVDRLAGLLDRFEPSTVVLAGDVLDAYGHVPREARRSIEAIRTAVHDRAAALVVVEGNHDAQLEVLLGGPPAPAHALDDGTVVCHGHERPALAGERYVIGHDHPAIDIEGRRRPCFLFGPGVFEGAGVLCLPAFNPGLRGTAVNAWTDGDALSPLLATSGDLRPLVWDAEAGEALAFPPLASLKPYL